MGSVTGAFEVLTEVLAPIPARTIVPGHGDPRGRDLIGLRSDICASRSTWCGRDWTRVCRRWR